MHLHRLRTPLHQQRQANGYVMITRAAKENRQEIDSLSGSQRNEMPQMQQARRLSWESSFDGWARFRVVKPETVGVGDGNRTRNVRSHSPVLCQLSYSHRFLSIIATSAGTCLESGPVLTLSFRP